MSRFFRNLIQIAYVVQDIEAAMKHWGQNIGVGPWFFLPHLAIQDFRYHGKPCDADISLALAQSCSVQIELIEQHNNAPSLYHGCLRDGAVSMQHHLGYGTMHFEEDMERLGIQYGIAQSGRTGTRGGFAYLKGDKYAGTIIEIIDLAKGRGELFDAIKTASVDWNGRDPIRTTLPA